MSRYTRVGDTQVGDILTLDEEDAIDHKGAIVGPRWRVAAVNPCRLELLSNHAPADCAANGCQLKHVWSPVFKDTRAIVH
jgi:hypothetical protein